MSLLGTIFGVVLSWIIGPHPLHVIACMVPLTIISMYSMYISSCLVVLRTMNVQRAEQVYHTVFKDVLSQLSGSPLQELKTHGMNITVPSCEEVAKQEVFVTRYKSVYDWPLSLQPILGSRPALLRGATFSTCIDLAVAVPLLCPPSHECSTGDPPQVGSWTASWHSHDMYAIAYRQQGENDGNVLPQTVLWHSTHAQAIDKLHAMWHVCAIRFFCALPSAYAAPAVQEVHELSQTLWPLVNKALMQANWATDIAYLDGEGGDLEPEMKPERGAV